MEKLNLTENGKKYLEAAAVIASVYLAMRYFSPIASPFLLAGLLAGILHPFIIKIHKKVRIKKSILTGIVLLVVCGALVMLIWALASFLIAGGSQIAARFPDYQKELGMLLGDCCDFMEKRFGVSGVQMENFVLEQVEIMIENLEVNVFPMIMGKSVDYMKSLFGFGSFLVIMVIAVLLIMKDYDDYAAKLQKTRAFSGVKEVAGKVIIYVKTFIRTQLIILCVISLICAVTLTLAGIKGGIFYGILTGLMDMLPFIGTGIMLLPLAIYLLLSGSIWKAVWCLLLYGVCVLIRELLEPKLIGEQMGVWPIGILFAVFAGVRLFGVWGIIKGPLSLIIICETCNYLWREKEPEGLQE